MAHNDIAYKTQNPSAWPWWINLVLIVLVVVIAVAVTYALQQNEHKPPEVSKKAAALVKEIGQSMYSDKAEMFLQHSKMSLRENVAKALRFADTWMNENDNEHEGHLTSITNRRQLEHDLTRILQQTSSQGSLFDQLPHQ